MAAASTATNSYHHEMIIEDLKAKLGEVENDNAVL